MKFLGMVFLGIVILLVIGASVSIIGQVVIFVVVIAFVFGAVFRMLNR